MPDYTEDDIRLAIHLVQNGLSIKKAASQNKIPYMTLSNRLKGTETRSQGSRHLQRLSSYQEEQLCNWLLLQDRLCMGLTHRQLRQLVEAILKAQNDLRPLGKNWIASFLRRNPRIKTLRARSLDSRRANGANPFTIQHFFDLLNQPGIRTIAPCNRWNMDEAGIFQALGINNLILGQANRKSSIKKKPGLSAWCTIIEAISGTGRFLDPLVIFKGKEGQQQWFPEDMNYLTHWNFTTSPNGWTSDAIGLEWLRTIFIPATRPQGGLTKRLLILDGHGSHATPEFMRLCIANRIQLLYLPPHTSHVLQPLDISVFGPLKSAYRATLDLASRGLSTSLTPKETFLECYFLSRKKALTEANILAGWLGSGLWPVNAAKALGSKFVIDDPATSITVANYVPIEQEVSQRTRETEFTTPRSSSQLHTVAVSAFKVRFNSPTVRRLFRKIDRGFDDLNWQLASLNEENRVLKSQLGQLKKRKRARVTRNLNREFFNIQNIQDTRDQMEPISNSNLEAEGSSESD